MLSTLTSTRATDKVAQGRLVWKLRSLNPLDSDQKSHRIQHWLEGRKMRVAIDGLKINQIGGLEWVECHMDQCRVTYFIDWIWMQVACMDVYEWHKNWLYSRQWRRISKIIMGSSSTWQIKFNSDKFKVLHSIKDKLGQDVHSKR